MDEADSYEVMVVEVKELGTEGLNVIVYDTRSDAEATVTQAIDGDAPTDDADWRQQVQDALTGPALVQYINHEWRNASVEYTEDGLIKEGGPMERNHESIIVTDPHSLTARIERLSDCYIVTVEADGQTHFERTYADSDLGLDVHPALRD